MPIVENDPWREQYFIGARCPDDLVIPTDDGDAYRLYPAHRWVYDKLRICETQDLPHGPHGVEPPAFPVFSKPIYNLRGMGSGTRLVSDLDQYHGCLTPGHMWMPQLSGEHVSTDVAVVDGEPRWWRHTTGVSLGDGLFDYWTVWAEPRPDLESYCGAWLERHLRGYTGMINFETIGARIIECHLRFADQWVDLYGPGWVQAVVGLHATGEWRFDDDRRRTGYSVVLFGAHGPRYHHVPPAVVAGVLDDPAISSVQITFHDDWPPERHAMPPAARRSATRRAA